jgi:hypothetical protein
MFHLNVKDGLLDTEGRTDIKGILLKQSAENFKSTGLLGCDVL